WHSALFGTWHFGTQLCLALGTLALSSVWHLALWHSPGSCRREPTLCRARRIFYNGTRFAPASPSMRILMKIVNYPHPSLRRRGVPVKAIDNRVRSYVQEMLALMYEG